MHSTSKVLGRRSMSWSPRRHPRAKSSAKRSKRKTLWTIWSIRRSSDGYHRLIGNFEAKNRSPTVALSGLWRRARLQLKSCGAPRRLMREMTDARSFTAPLIASWWRKRCFWFNSDLPVRSHLFATSAIWLATRLPAPAKTALTHDAQSAKSLRTSRVNLQLEPIGFWD